jgi:hypothetical protein
MRVAFLLFAAKFYAQMQPLADGRTASQTLLDQLRVLSERSSLEFVPHFDSKTSTILSDSVFHQAVAGRVGILLVKRVIETCRDFPSVPKIPSEQRVKLGTT